MRHSCVEVCNKTEINVHRKKHYRASLDTERRKKKKDGLLVRLLRLLCFFGCLLHLAFGALRHPHSAVILQLRP